MNLYGHRCESLDSNTQAATPKATPVDSARSLFRCCSVVNYLCVHKMKIGKIEPHQLRGSVVMLLVAYHYVTHSAFMRLTSIQASVAI